jgi:hypothetical protein
LSPAAAQQQLVAGGQRGVVQQTMPNRLPSSRRTVLLPIFAIALALAGRAAMLLVGRVANTFSDQASVSGNTFSTAACFPTWWDANYLYRQRVTVTTGGAGVSSGYEKY